ncbi:MAG: FAD-dependent oxidoreductase [Rhodospirillaceae bacterium]|nr:FAD-dependent oxidoreductase [Rhodospirillaceae bacterium]MBT6203379.1 FAD-dependent oxidoreductase [Rhodospirillaceae bacterium]MBT7615293.1 FAD-dependent oxidoreductase [Rhodospirillaceae bacterium]MBT7647378.1 FAD-dependent oxidoreductase [Rhodospirillaceae bacterium]
MSSQFPHLFSEIALGRTMIRNRIVSTGHHTHHSHGAPSERYIAYQEARAKGGAGLIVAEVAGIHETAHFANHFLQATSPDCVPGYRDLAQAVHRHGAALFGQLFHPGREVQATADGMLATAYAPSAVPNERFHIMPRPMSQALIEEVIGGFGRGAGYLVEAGLDGVELVASQGYLPAQFLNPRLNLRDDAWGGSFENRLRFVQESIRAMRAAIGDATLGMRISGDELEPAQGLTGDDVAEICAVLAPDLDYISVVAGMSSSLGASVHIAAPMGVPAGYVAPYARRIKETTGLPVIATGRIGQPQIAEAIVAAGDADLCGMTRALICDPQMPAKTRDGNLDEIRACIACNQACIGRAHAGMPISCIQYPESGREIEYGVLSPTKSPKSVMVVGGGPAGLKAAAVAAERGHRVTLYEASDQLGGQALLAQKLPGREEFGGIIQNLVREAEQAGVSLLTRSPVDVATIKAAEPDALILATGAVPYAPEIEGADEAHVVDAWAALNGANIGNAVVIADWRCDWVGIGLAEMLAASGRHVRLMVNGAMPGETLQLYVRNHYVGRLHRLGVEITTHARLFGTDADSAFFQDTLTDELVVAEDMDTLVLSLGHMPQDALGQSLEDAGVSFTRIGDCLAPRTAEEAVLEGLQIAWEL